MGLTNSDYEAVMREYDGIRYKNASILEERTKDVFSRIPAIRTINDEIISGYASLAKSALYLSNEAYLAAKEEFDKACILT